MTIIKNRKAGDTSEENFTSIRYTCFSISKKTITGIQQYLSIPEINCVFSTSATDMIVDGTLVGGRARSSNEILIALNPKGNRKQLKKELSSVICHEVHHSQRMSSVGYGDTLFEAILSEGLACHFEHMLFPEIDLPYIKSDPQELSSIINNLPHKNIDDIDSVHSKRFFQQHNNRPKRSGYKLGYAIVDILCNKLGKNAGELVNTSFHKLESDFMHAIDGLSKN